MTAPSPSPRLRPGPLLAGLALLVVYARMDAVFDLGARAGTSSMLYIAPFEYLFWLCHLVLAVPGLLLVAWGLAPRLAPELARAWHALAGWDRRRWRLAAVGYFLLLLAVAVAGRELFLLDLPVTDDENAVTFGARMIAGGALSVPEPQPAGAYDLAFVYRRDGRVMAMDFPGGLFFAALALVTGLGSWLYAATAAATGVAVAAAAGRLAGWRAAVVAALGWLFSPMALFLSLTEHAHLPSRALLAGALLAWAALVGRDGEAPAASSVRRPRRAGALLGLAAGLGFCFRPFETAFILAPVAVDLLLRARGEPRRWLGPLAAATATLALPLAAFAAYNAATTGRWYLQARFAPGVGGAAAWNDHTPWDRLAGNTGFNLLMLAVYLLGLAAVPLLVAGFARRRRAARVLAASFVGALVLGLAHDSTGIHVVGPIHYSESAVLLVLVATLGVIAIADAMARRRQPRAEAALLVATYLVAALGLFDLTHLRSLRLQAEVQRLPLAAAEEAGIAPAVVLAPQPAFLSEANRRLGRAGTWVLYFPHPDPWLRDPVIFARPDADPAQLGRHFPGRRLFRMRYHAGETPVTIEPIDRP